MNDDVHKENIQNLLALIGGLDDRIARLEARIVALEGENIDMKDVGRLAENVRDAFGQIARMTDLPLADVFDTNWRTRTNG